jgi:excisionase family DNA binding protein
MKENQNKNNGTKNWDGWLDSREAANYVGLKSSWSFKTVEQWARSGKLKHGRAGDLFRYKKEWLDQFITNNAVK